MRKIPYTLHRERESQFNALVKCLDKQRNPDAVELKALALNKLRIDQKLDAHSIFGLAGKTVHAYDGARLVAKIHNCVVGDATATVCFVLEEHSNDGVVVNCVSVTHDMDLYVEDPHG